MIEQWKEKYNLEVKENEPLSNHTTFKIGGPAKYFVQVNNKVDLRRALQLAIDNKLKYLILGGGSNVLVSDSGFDGLIINVNEGDYEVKGDKVLVFAGNYWPKFVNQVIQNGLEGLEFSGNIPGSVGGCVRGNAGAYGQGVGDFVFEVEVLVVGDNEVSLKKLTQAECEFEYRESIFKKQSNLIISEVVFHLKPETKSIEERLKEVAAEGATRCAKQPLRYPSAGCSFVNVVYDDSLAQYKDWESNGKIAAARFIDAAGLKGTQIGQAKISEEHVNFIINLGGATANDVIQLYSLVKMKVRDQFGVQLQEEVQYVGFDF